MQTEIIYFDSSNIDNIYNLLEEIYTSSDTMSEAFFEKFPEKTSCKQYFEKILELQGGLALFAVLGKKYVGYLTITPRYQSRIRHTSELNMGVLSGYQKNGIGYFLINEAFRILKGYKFIEIVYLMVRSDNSPAIRLYEKVGFEKMALLKRDTKIEDIYFDGILMRKFVHQ